MVQSLKVFYHAHCLDGAATAAVFADFFRQRHPDVEIHYKGLEHSQHNPYQDVSFDADVHACVDFRFCADPRVSWWIDHHISAFQGTDDTRFQQDTTGQLIYDSETRSCVALAVRELAQRFNYKPQFGSVDFIEWADKIDAADFEDAAEAISLSPPAMKISAWLRAQPSQESMARLIECLGHERLADIIKRDWLASDLIRIEREHRQALRSLKQATETKGNVAYFCELDKPSDFSNKLAIYYLFPTAYYGVGVFRCRNAIKISVGVNPWAKPKQPINIARLCERFGGGGHPYVGGISLPADDDSGALDVATTIISKLNHS